MTRKADSQNIYKTPKTVQHVGVINNNLILNLPRLPSIYHLIY